MRANQADRDDLHKRGGQELLANAKMFENIVQDLVGSDLARDFAQRIEAIVQIHTQELARHAVAQA